MWEDYVGEGVGKGEWGDFYQPAAVQFVSLLDAEIDNSGEGSLYRLQPADSHQFIHW